MRNSNLAIGCAFTRYLRFVIGTIFLIPGLTLRGHRRSKIKVDLGVLGISFYKCLIVTIALSSTVWPQYKTRRMDRRTDMLVRRAHLMHCALHALHRWAKLTIKASDLAIIWWQLLQIWSFQQRLDVKWKEAIQIVHFTTKTTTYASRPLTISVNGAGRENWELLFSLQTSSDNYD